MTDARRQGPTASQGTDTPDRRRARLDKALARTTDAPLRIGNRLALLQNGADTYDDWIAAIARAERWVHLDNYIFQDDAVGRRFADALKKKARERVTVRMLSDWFGS
jgi:cardiolipin synthase